MAGFKVLYDLFFDKGGKEERKLYDNDLIDRITKEINERPLTGAKPVFLRVMDFQIVDFFNSECFDRYEGGVVRYADSTRALNAKNLDALGNYVLIFNTGNHFISVSVQKTERGVNYIVQDSGDKNYGEINSLGEYIAKVRAANVENEFAQRKASIEKDPDTRRISEKELRAAIAQEKTSRNS